MRSRAWLARSFPSMPPATTRFLSARWKVWTFTKASRSSICAETTEPCAVSGRHGSRPEQSSLLMMPAERIALYSVLRPPLIGHVRANLPQLREKFVPHAFFENFHGPALQRFRSKANRAMNQLHVLVTEFLKQLIEFRHRFRDHVSVAVRVLRVVDFFQRQAVLIQIVLLERTPQRLVHF